MEEVYANAIIDSTKKYFDELATYGKNDIVSLKDIIVLNAIKQTFDAADWFEISEETKILLQKKINEIILSNQELAYLDIPQGVYYSNVSMPQTIYTWQRVYDNLLVQTHNSI